MSDSEQESGILSYIEAGLQSGEMYSMLSDTPGLSQKTGEFEDLDLTVSKTHGKIREIMRQLKDTTEKGVRKQLKEKAHSLIQAAKRRTQSSGFVRKRDEYAFMFGVYRLLIEAFVAGKYPCFYPYIHSITFFVLIVLRFIQYKQLKYHYFMLDFCYYINILFILFLFVWPESPLLTAAMWGFTQGSLALAVPLYRNSLVFHSLDKTTSTFIHISPMFTFWAINMGDCRADYNISYDIGFIDYISGLVIVYACWGIPYYLFMFKLAWNRWHRKQNTTFYSWNMQREGQIKTAAHRFTEKNRPFAFMFFHFLISFCLGLIFYPTLGNVVALTVIGALTLSSTLFNSAKFYMEIFAKNYNNELEELDKISKDAGQETSDS